LPQLEIQQSPYAISMIAMLGSMFGEDLLDGLGPEQAPRLSSWLQKQALDLP
jgi:hypothetical protein